MNTLDRVIEFFSPKTAMLREAHRKALYLQRGYDAGGMGKRQSKIDRRNRSAAAETLDTLDKIRGFSRELERNDAIAKKALILLTNNIVGEGIRPAIVADVPLTQRKAKELWAAFMETSECDYEGMRNVYGMQALTCTSTNRDGEFLAIRRRDPTALLGFRIQLLEADFLDATKTLEIETGYIVQGVEFNRSNKRVAYWIHKTNPNDSFMGFSYESVRVPVEDVAHIFRQDRAGQVRGIPTGVQAFLTLKDLGEYEDAELVRKKIAACYTAFVTTTDGIITPNDKREASRMEPGTIQFLPHGDKVEIASPPTDSGNGSYTRERLQRAAMAYEVSYEGLSGDLSTVNFSSGKMGWIEIGRGFRRWQSEVYIPQFCDRIFQWFVEGAMLTGQLRTKPSVSWTPPRREMIDQQKEVQGIIALLRGGLGSWQEAVRELGWDKDQLIAEIEQDKEIWDKLGLKPEFDPRFDKEPKAAAK